MYLISEEKAVLFVFLWVFQCHNYRVSRDDEVINVELIQKQSYIEKEITRINYNAINHIHDTNKILDTRNEHASFFTACFKCQYD